MPRSRCIPTKLFQEVDFFDLESDTQLVLIGLTLRADDQGRGLAHTGLLSRELNKRVAIIDRALDELEAAEWIICYQVGRHRYYQHLRWWEWQAGLHKPAASDYPAPEGWQDRRYGTSEPAPVQTAPARAPETVSPHAEPAATSATSPRISPDFSGKKL